MGMRSQIYVRFTNPETGKKYLIARYFGWNYGERMVSRVRNTIEFIECQLNSTDIGKLSLFGSKEFDKKLVHIMETNFDMKDVMFSSNIINEFMELYPDEPFREVFTGQDNNNGQAFIDVILKDKGSTVKRFSKDYKEYEVNIRYAFTESTDSEKSLTSYGYLVADLGENWESKEGFDEESMMAIRSNMAYLDKFSLIPPPELEEYRDYDYISDMGLERKVEAV